MVIVDGKRSQDLILGKAVDFAERFSADLHFIRFLNRMKYMVAAPVDYHMAPELSLNNEKRQLEHSLQELKSYWKKRTELEIHTEVLRDLPNRDLINYIGNKEIDMIIILGISNRYLWSYFRSTRIERIIRTVNCPVLTITEWSVKKNFRQIVLSVGHVVPARKLRLAYIFAKTFTARIHLISGTNENTGENRVHKFDTLLATLNLINSWGGVEAECKTFDDTDSITAAIEYARKIGADLLIVNTQKEFPRQGLFHSIFGAPISTAMNIPVLTVKPFP
jgi:nucleotide-binding universal stress UspA family protein